MKVRNQRILLPLLCLFSLLIYSDVHPGVRVRIGIYQNHPLCFTDTKGEARGIYMDLLTYIAQKEGWEIEYMTKSWDDSLKLLDQKKIDLMCGIAYTEKRAEHYIFNKENVILDWGQIYLPKGSDIQSVVDLNGKKVATVEGGILLSAFKELTEQFGVFCDFTEVKDPHDVLRMIEQGKVDAGTVLRFFGMRCEDLYAVKPSPIIFAPLQLRFATADPGNYPLLHTIDTYLRLLKKTENSILYESVERWMGIEHKNWKPPAWLLLTFAVTLGLAVSSFVISFLLKRQVSLKTAELEERNNALKNEILIREHAEEKVKASLREKEVLLREICHRTKNNMQVIRSMLALQASMSDNDKVKKVFKDTENRILAMALVHQMLYQSEDLSSISLKDYINELAALLLKSYKAENISYISEAANDSVLIDIAVPCGLVLNELITNSVKYAFPGRRRGEIRIRSERRDNQEIVICYSDNGIGFPKDFDFEDTPTLGLRMICSIVEHQLDGSVTFETGNGISCQIQFKENLYSKRI